MMWISKGLLPGVAMVALMVILVTGSAASQVSSYNDLVMRANRAAMAGNLTTAISLWKQAHPLEVKFDRTRQSIPPKCYGSITDRAIQAASLAIRSHPASKTEAAAAYQRVSMARTMHDPCNLP